MRQTSKEHVHDRAQSLVFRSYTTHEILYQNVSILVGSSVQRKQLLFFFFHGQGHQIPLSTMKRSNKLFVYIVCGQKIFKVALQICPSSHSPTRDSRKTVLRSQPFTLYLVIYLNMGSSTRNKIISLLN